MAGAARTVAGVETVKDLNDKGKDLGKVEVMETLAGRVRFRMRTGSRLLVLALLRVQSRWSC